MCQKAVDIDVLREKFRRTVREYVKRDGVESLLEWLDTTDFYSAPASARYHSMFQGGLCLHSLNVFNMTRAGIPRALARGRNASNQIISQKTP